MQEETERNPVLAAPGSKDIGGLIASSTTETNRADSEKFQGLSDEEANALCKQDENLKLAYGIARQYWGKGIETKELRAASLLGLVEASRNFDPILGIPFGGFAHHRIRGAVKDLFRRGKFAPDFQPKESLKAPIIVD